jgi:glycosyltransferase involved in cell wall biosynthesis
MKIGFASRWDPLDKRSWSGTCYYTYQQLKRFGEVEIFQFRIPKLLQEWLTTQKSINRRWFKKMTATEFLDAYARNLSRQLTKELKKRPVDILFIPASSQLGAYLKTDIPVVYMTDATFQQLQGYYSTFSNLAGYNVKQGIALDKKCFEKAAHCLLASDWCGQSAIKDYGIDPHRVSVAACGPNLDILPASEEIKPYPSGTFRILFLGVEWDRKGGDIVLETFRILSQKGLDVHLHIIGCVPPVDTSQDPRITVIPYLNKNKEEEFRQLQQLFTETALLFLPTRAECAGIVFSEASAYGIPSLSTDTGGVTTYVKNEVNGFTLPLAASADAYAVVIEQLYHDRELLNRLRYSSRQYFEDNLNWDKWGDIFVAIARRLVAK